MQSFKEFLTEKDMEGFKKVGEDEFQEVVTKNKAKSTSRTENGTDVVSYSANGKVVAKLINPEGEDNASYYISV